MNDKLAGDERGVVTIEFTAGALEAFVELINGAHIVRDGNLYEFRVDEYEPGRAQMVSTIYYV